MSSGRPVLPMPQAYITLAEIGGVLARLVATASLILQPLNYIFSVMNSAAGLVNPPNELRHFLLASAELLLDGPSRLLTAAAVSAQGPAHVVHLVTSIKSGILIEVYIRGSTISDRVCSLMAQLQQQCLSLLNDPAIAAQLQQRYLPPHIAGVERTSCAEELAYVVDFSSALLLVYMRKLWTSLVDLPTTIGSLATNQKLLQALSAAMVWLLHLQASGVKRPEIVQEAELTAYKIAAYLRDVTMRAVAALHDCPSLLWRASGLVSAVAGVAADVLAFAQHDSRVDQRPPDVQGRLPGYMQCAAEAAKYLHLSAQELSSPGTSRRAETARSALKTQGASTGSAADLAFQADNGHCYSVRDAGRGSAGTEVHGHLSWRYQAVSRTGSWWQRRCSGDCRGAWRIDFCLTFSVCQLWPPGVKLAQSMLLQQRPQRLLLPKLLCRHCYRRVRQLVTCTA